MADTEKGEDADTQPTAGTLPRKNKKLKKKRLKEGKDDAESTANSAKNDAIVKKKKQKTARLARTTPAASSGGAAVGGGASLLEGLSPAQQAVQEQMRRALEEDQYSAAGSIVDTESDEDDNYNYRGQAVRLDRAFMQQTVRKLNMLERVAAATAPTSAATANQISVADDEFDDDYYQEAAASNKRGNNKTKKKKKRKDEVSQLVLDDSKISVSGSNSSSIGINGGILSVTAKDPFMLDGGGLEDDLERDGGSIFGATAGSSNSTWVECDKCKKWRRLRGVVDEKKLPSKWYCSMNKNDPERARCSAPEEEYETPHTPETAADARTRKHLRVWVRRLQSNEAYEARLPTLTRGAKAKRAGGTASAASSTNSTSKDPYEWVRCCNPSCGKWRAILRIMDAKTNVIDRVALNNGEWYCVMNTWDEKTASCAAPQENLPAIGCPRWILQDE